MQYITDAEEAKLIDNISINDIGIPSSVLMEKAAMQVENYIIERFKEPEKAWNILVVSGSGNNGGDGIAIGRLLHEKGYHVSILILGNQDKVTPEMHTQITIAVNLGMNFVTQLIDDEYNIIIDAIFGIGLSRDITGQYADIIEQINIQNAFKIAVDIPSGISATTGHVLGIAVKADTTITFGTYKTGLLLFPGTIYAGEVIVVDIGFPLKALQQVKPQKYTYDQSDLAVLMPGRKPRSNKGSYGKVLVIAGSKDMCGACFFAAAAAYRTGCGLVRILSSRDNTDILKSRLPEAIIGSYEIDNIDEAIEWADVIVVGPGLGISRVTTYIVEKVIDITDKTVIIDADGLNALSKLNKSAHNIFPYELPDNFIITPHLKEMSRLTGDSVDTIKDNIIETASSQNNGCTIVLKDARTIVSNGNESYINTTGNNALATGGSGDVLCGIISGLAAQGLTPFSAAKTGVLIHGLTADIYASTKTRYSMIASDIIEMLPEVLPY